MKRLLLILLLLSSLASAGIIPDMHPKTFSEGVNEYVEVNLGCSADLCYDSETCTVSVAKESVIPLLKDYIIEDAPLVHMNSLGGAYLKYPDGVYGWLKPEDVREGNYFFTMDCSPSDIHKQFRFKVRPADGTGFWADVTNSLGLSVGGVDFFGDYIKQVGTKYDKILVMLTVAYQLFDLALFIMIASAKYFYVYMLGIEAFICVYSFIRSGYSGYQMIINFFVFNASFIVTTTHLFITVSKFILAITIDVVLTTLRSLGAIGIKIPFV